MLHYRSSLCTDIHASRVSYPNLVALHPSVAESMYAFSRLRFPLLTYVSQSLSPCIFQAKHFRSAVAPIISYPTRLNSLFCLLRISLEATWPLAISEEAKH